MAASAAQQADTDQRAADMRSRLERSRQEVAELRERLRGALIANEAMAERLATLSAASLTSSSSSSDNDDAADNPAHRRPKAARTTTFAPSRHS